MGILLLLFLVGCEYLPEKTAVGAQTDGATLSVAVADALRANAQTSLLRVTVTNPVEGKIRLQGVVDNDGIRVAAEQIASSVEGVTSVINTLYLY